MQAERKKNAFKLGRKAEFIARAENIMWVNFKPFFEHNHISQTDVNQYLQLIWNNQENPQAMLHSQYIDACLLGVYLGYNYLHDPLRKTLLHKYGGWTNLAYQREELRHIQYIDYSFASHIPHIIRSLNFRVDDEKLLIQNIINQIEQNYSEIFSLYSKEAIDQFLFENIDFNILKDNKLVYSVNDALYAIGFGLDFKKNPLIKETKKNGE